MLTIAVDTKNKYTQEPKKGTFAGDMFKQQLIMNEESDVMEKIMVNKKQEVDESKTAANQVFQNFMSDFFQDVTPSV